MTAGVAVQQGVAADGQMATESNDHPTVSRPRRSNSSGWLLAYFELLLSGFPLLLVTAGVFAGLRQAPWVAIAVDGRPLRSGSGSRAYPRPPRDERLSRGAPAIQPRTSVQFLFPARSARHSPPKATPRCARRVTIKKNTRPTKLGCATAERGSVWRGGQRRLRSASGPPSASPSASRLGGLAFAPAPSPTRKALRAIA